MLLASDPSSARLASLAVLFSGIHGGPLSNGLLLLEGLEKGLRKTRDCLLGASATKVRYTRKSLVACSWMGFQVSRQSRALYKAIVI